MQTKTVTIPNVSCNHCKMRIEKTVSALAGVQTANVAVTPKTLTVNWDETQLPWDAIQQAVTKLGYPPEA
jgi:copper chaperone